jgi:nucleoside-diphosphate-sugar epimerase
MKILLTGHTGFIGTYFYKNLKKDYEVCGIDLSEGNDLLSCELPTDIDLVIHLAGKSGVRESINNPNDYWINNVEASKRLFKFYRNTKILYASSSTVYNPDLNPYAKSKFCLEQLAKDHNNNLGMRFHTVYSKDSRKGMFVEKLLSNTLTYTTSHFRDFIHLNDLFSAVKVLINSDITGCIDIGTGKPVLVSSLAPSLPIKDGLMCEQVYTCANIKPLLDLGWRPEILIQDFLIKVKT